jgi:pepF/M3 family oligoendopeptidase
MDGGQAALPRWEMESIFGSEPGAADRAFAAALGGIDELAALFDALQIGPRPTSTVDAETISAVETTIDGWNRIVEAVGVQFNYLGCLVAADTGNEAARAALSELQQRHAVIAVLSARFTAWIGSLDLEALIAASPLARDHAFMLRDAQENAAHLMSQAEESLAAELAPSGATAWFRLREDIDASLVADFEVDGEVKRLPLTEIDDYLSKPDRALRVRAHHAIEGARRAATVPLAAALNGVKGEQIALAARRNWVDPLDAALAANKVDRITVETMLSAIRGALPIFHRFLAAKAVALGLPVLAIYDFFAPVSEAGENWPYDEAVRFIVEQFATYSPRLAELATRATSDGWIDVGPRGGKVGGGFCASLGRGRSRILLNYTPTHAWMSATAHELGHAYHSLVAHEYGRSHLQQSLTPPTLAETASTFCETIVQRSALTGSPEAERMELLNGILQSQSSNVFLTVAMYDLERAIFSARAKRALSGEELSGITVWAQQAIFGESIDHAVLRPSLWVANPHLFLPDLAYYNFPYAFGLLFGLGLYARYQETPAGFCERFDGLLADTGMANARDLAARFGIDLHDRAFWETGLAAIEQNVSQFEALVDKHSRP